MIKVLRENLLVQVAAWGNKVSSRWLPSVRQLEGLTHLK